MAKRAATPTATRKPRTSRAKTKTALDDPAALVPDEAPIGEELDKAAATLGGAETDDEDSASDTGGNADDGELKKPELIRRVVNASGIKKKTVKPVVEAMLKELGDALTNGETMNLQPFGKVQINRTKDKDNGEVLIVKIRRNQQAVDETVSVDEKKGPDPLAEAAE